jgi:anti-sigma-K factor RskA
MSEPKGNGSVDGQLAWQALLYAGGELEGAEEEAFEVRLAGDQALREALCQATQMLGALESRAPLSPRPDYRQAVRAELRPSMSFWQRLKSPQAYPGHPIVWGIAGAAASLLLMVGLGRLSEISSNKPPCPVRPGAIQSGGTHLTKPESQYASLAETADIWAAMHPSDHLSKAHDEEARRRSRGLDKPRFGRSEERRISSDSPYKPL